MLPGCVYSKEKTGQTDEREAGSDLEMCWKQYQQPCLSWTSLAVHFCFRNNKIKSFVFTGLSLTGFSGGFSCWTGIVVLPAPLKHKGPWDRARWRVRVQVLTGLFCHDQLVLCLSINHRFPITHLQRRQATITNGCQTSTGYIHTYKTLQELWGRKSFHDVWIHAMCFVD